MAMPSRELTPGMIRDIKVQRKKREGREEREDLKKKKGRKESTEEKTNTGAGGECLRSQHWGGVGAQKDRGQRLVGPYRETQPQHQ